MNIKTAGEAPTVALLKGGAITFYNLYKAKGLNKKGKRRLHFIQRGFGEEPNPESRYG